MMMKQILNPEWKQSTVPTKFLKLIDEAVELMRKYHPQGERYYWILYYTYMSAYQPNNITEIINKLEPHLSQNVRINRSTYFSVERKCSKSRGRYSVGLRDGKPNAIRTLS